MLRVLPNYLTPRSKPLILRPRDSEPQSSRSAHETPHSIAIALPKGQALPSRLPSAQSKGGPLPGARRAVDPDSDEGPTLGPAHKPVAPPPPSTTR